jgi:hypothetical protein
MRVDVKWGRQKEQCARAKAVRVMGLRVAVGGFRARLFSRGHDPWQCKTVVAMAVQVQ